MKENFTARELSLLQISIQCLKEELEAKVIRLGINYNVEQMNKYQELVKLQNKIINIREGK